MRKFLFKAAFAAVLPAALLSFHTLGAQEPLLDILRGELAYEAEKLSASPAPPYYMNFRVTDTRRRTVSASFGVLAGSTDTRERVFKPQVRLGSPDLDNFRGSSEGGRFSGKVLLPLSDDNPNAIRQAIWAEVENEYRASVTEIERLRAAERVNVARDDRAPDFSPAPVEKYYEAPLEPEETAFDIPEMERRTRAYSAAFLAIPDILGGTASIDFTVQRKYLVSTEGTEVVQNSAACRLMINATVRTGDGMDLPLYKSYFAFSPRGLPSDEEVLAEARDMARTLAAMKDAPAVDPYAGPAILSGEAAGVFFHEIFGHRIEGQRMKSDSDGGTFKKMVGQSVLPRHFSVWDDPTLTDFGGDDLYGHYLYDDQGVRARRVNVVGGGVLNEFLMTRTPTDEFGVSNGHARAQENLNPVSRQSNLVIETSKPLTEAQLRKALIREAKAQKRDFGLWFKEVTGGFTQTGRYSPNSFNVTPLEVYKIYVDGRPDELVRGVDLIGTPLSMFAGIVEAGGESEIFTGVCGAESGGVPVTAISPPILVRKVEVQRKAKTPDTPPALERPDEAVLGDGDEEIFGAMSAELDRSMNELRTPDVGGPFRIDYLYCDIRAMAVTASLGEIVVSRLQPQRMNGVRLMLGDHETTSDLVYNGEYNIRGVATETDGAQIRRELWLNTDASYKRAAADMARKLAIRHQRARTPEEEALPDLAPTEAIETILESPAFGLDLPAWERRVAELSAVFAEYPFLYGSQVRLMACDWTNYTFSSDGMRTRQPASFASVAVSATVRTADGGEFSDGVDIYATSDLTLPTQEDLLEWVRGFARRLSEWAQVPKFEEFYSGPVLFTGQAVFSMFDDNLLSTNGNSLIIKRAPEIEQGRLSVRRLENRMGQRVLDRKLTVTNHSSMRHRDGVPLLGYYETDADGVAPAASSVLVEDGILVGLLSGRIPTLGARNSTGSNRFSAQMNPYIAPGTLEISADEGEGRSVAGLERELISMAAADGLKYAYIVERMGGRMNMVWRVDVSSGERTPVRGAEVSPVTLLQLRRVAGISEESEVRNYLAGQVPASMIYPRAVLLEDVEIGVSEAVGKKPSPIVNPLERD